MMSLACPECTDTPDRIHIYKAGSTMLGSMKFQDKDGDLHVHNPNTISYRYNCSNGHEWYEGKREPCPICGDGWDDAG